MKFPGKRKSRHYFPVEDRIRHSFTEEIPEVAKSYIVGIDQLLVDIEAKIQDAILHDFDLKKGQSTVLNYEKAEELYQFLKNENLIVGEYAGGSTGNTLHNYSVLADAASVALGVISKNITVGDYAFKYICSTHNHVDLSYLQPVVGRMGRAFCLVSDDGERTFGICKGRSNDLSCDFIPENVLSNANALLISAYLLRDETSAIYESTMKSVQIAKANGVPVVFSTGTSFLIEEKSEFFREFVQNNVDVLAMNKEEAMGLTGIDDPLLAAEACLDMTDLVLLTNGARGLYVCGWVDDVHKRETDHPLHSKSLPEYNRYEFSRPMPRDYCLQPLKIYSHINPYMGGPGAITNTNGAGDAALAALLHDMAANNYHKQMVPNSSKHENQFLCYSSLSQVCKYANRASYEVLRQNSPRLLKELPEKEDSLEESYWAQ